MILVARCRFRAMSTPTRITATELARGLSDILDRAQRHGERFIVLRNGEPVATIGSPSPLKAPTLAELAEQLRNVSVPHDGFGDVLVEIKANQRHVTVDERSPHVARKPR